jgi:outer membrane cobalamin receptor
MKTSDSLSSRRCLSSAGPLRCSAFLAVICLISGTVFGGVEGKKDTKKEVKAPQKSKPAAEEKVLITGSLIPQKVKANRIPVTTSPVIIIGQRDIDHTGASTVTDLLRRQIGR